MSIVTGLLAVMALLALPVFAADAQGTGGAAPAGTVRSIELPDIPVQLKEGENAIKAETHCAVCHSVDYIPMQPAMTRAQWSAGVNKMIKTFGAQISQEDAEAIVDYLTVNYGTGK